MDDYSTLFNVLQNQANANNAWSAEQAQKQMDFQERMSNTAHAREMADLKASGLNPILSAKLGGASTPSGASATADTSIVSSMVQLMDKMLEVADTSAKAVASSSRGSNGNVMVTPQALDFGDYNNSGYAQLVNTVNESPLDPSLTGSIANSIGLPSWIGKGVAEFINGVKGTPSNKNETSKMTYKVGEAVQPVRQATMQQHADDQAKLMSSNYGQTITAAMDKAKAEGKGIAGQWIAGTNAQINYVANQAKSAVSNLANKISNVIKKSPSSKSTSSYSSVKKGSTR